MGIFSANVFDPNYGQQFTDAILAQPDVQKPDAPRRGGLFGRLRNDPAMGDRIRAALAMLQGDQGTAARYQQLQLERQRLGLQQQEAQQQQRQRDDQIWAAKQNGFSPSQISQLNVNDLSQLGRERFTPRQYGPEGGSTGYTNADGTTRYEIAPYQRQVGRTVIGAGPNGADQRVIFRGSETIGVPNVGIFGSTELGPYQQGEAPPLGFLPQAGQSAPPIAGSESQLPPAAGPQVADTRPQGMEAPAFNANPTDLSAMPPVASYRGVEFGPPLAGGRPRNMPPRMAARPPRGIVNVNSPEQAARLPRGTRFRTPDGRVIVRQ